MCVCVCVCVFVYINIDIIYGSPSVKKYYWVQRVFAWGRPMFYIFRITNVCFVDGPLWRMHYS